MEKPRGFFHTSAQGSGLYPFTAVLFFCGKGGKETDGFMMNCFAFCMNGYCGALGGKCRGENCGFHKTHEEQAQSLEKVRERLRSLPEYQQEAIAYRYYHNVRKW